MFHSVKQNRYLSFPEDILRHSYYLLDTLLLDNTIIVALQSKHYGNSQSTAFVMKSGWNTAFFLLMCPHFMKIISAYQLILHIKLIDTILQFCLAGIIACGLHKPRIGKLLTLVNELLLVMNSKKRLGNNLMSQMCPFVTKTKTLSWRMSKARICFLVQRPSWHQSDKAPEGRP